MLLVIRVVAMLLYFLGVAALGLLLCLVRPFNADNSRLIARWYAWGGLKILGLKVQADGLEHFDLPGTYIVVANHQDNLDLFVLGGYLPRRTVSVGKKSLRWIPLFGIMYWLAGNVLIDRGDRRRAMDAMGAVVTALQERNTRIWIFPEGTRSRGRGLLPFKKGAFHTAIKAGVPIVPVCVSSYAQQANFNRLTSGKVRLQVLEPISTEGLTGNDVPELMERCREQMQASIAELDQQTQSAPRSRRLPMGLKADA